MRASRRSPRGRVTRINRLWTGALLVLLRMALPGGVAAECNPEGRYPAFAETAATARTIVIGDVVDVNEGGAVDPVVDGWSPEFTIRVAATIRGSAPLIWELSRVATVPCAPLVVVRVGDRIALALDARRATTGSSYSTVAWVAGQPPTGIAFERITDADALAFRTGPEVGEGGPAADPDAFARATQTVLGLIVAATLLALIGRRVVGGRGHRTSG